MIFYITLKHNGKKDDRVIIDSLTLLLKDNSKINIEWESSDWSYEDKQTYCRLKGILFNDEYANEKLSLIKDNIKEIEIKSFGLTDDIEYKSKVSYLEVRDAESTWILDLKKGGN